MNTMKRNELHPPYSPQKYYFLGNAAQNGGFGEKIFFWQGVFADLKFISLHIVHILTPREMNDLGKAKNMNIMNIYAGLLYKEIFSRMVVMEKEFMKKNRTKKGQNFIRFINPVNGVAWLVGIWCMEFVLGLAGLVWCVEAGMDVMLICGWFFMAIAGVVVVVYVAAALGGLMARKEGKR
jgi:hypothetical protein